MIVEIKNEVKIFQKDEIFKSLFRYNYFFTYLYKAFLEYMKEDSNIEVMSVTAENLMMPDYHNIQEYYGDLVGTLDTMDIISIEMYTGRFNKLKFKKSKGYLNRLYVNQLPKIKNKKINNYRNLHKVINISFINSDCDELAPRLINKYCFMEEGSMFGRDDEDTIMYLVRLDLVKEIAYNEDESKFIRLLRMLNAISYEELERLAKGDETMEDMIEYVKEWCRESEKNGKEDFIENLKDDIREEAREEWIEIGTMEGIKIGIEKNRLDIAALLLKKKYPINEIIEITGLSRKEVLDIR